VIALWFAGENAAAPPPAPNPQLNKKPGLLAVAVPCKYALFRLHWAQAIAPVGFWPRYWVAYEI